MKPLDVRVRKGVGSGLLQVWNLKTIIKRVLVYPMFCLNEEDSNNTEHCVKEFFNMVLVVLEWNSTPENVRFSAIFYCYLTFCLHEMMDFRLSTSSWPVFLQHIRSCWRKGFSTSCLCCHVPTYKWPIFNNNVLLGAWYSDLSVVIVIVYIVLFLFPFF